MWAWLWDAGPSFAPDAIRRERRQQAREREARRMRYAQIGVMTDGMIRQRDEAIGQ